MVELLEKVDSGNELTALEAGQVRLQAASILRRWEYEYGEYGRGLLTEDEYNIPQKRQNLQNLRNMLLP